MKVIFVLPCVGRKKDGPYVKSWQMEPLAIAVLSAHTPKDIDRVFYDDRIESIPYDEPTDLVAINVETYTARRAYQIAAEFKKRNRTIVMGGFHATLLPDEILQHADCVVIGQGEEIWPRLLDDFMQNKLAERYQGNSNFEKPGIMPDRSIYADKMKKYTKITLIETGRGCPFGCEFCSISSFFHRKYYARPVEDVVAEIKALNAKQIFFIDDNISVDPNRTRELCRALEPLKVEWIGQVSINVTEDEDLLELMRKSGCLGVLIGFESLNKDNLRDMGKNINTLMDDYENALARLRKHYLGIYATFLFGYDHDTEQTFQKTLEFSTRHRFFFTAFNHVVPFPGTPMYDRLKKENRLLDETWWLSDKVRFGDIVFRPKALSPEELSGLCLSYRQKFYSPMNIIKRMEFRINCGSPMMFAAFVVQNLISQKDVALRQGLPLGLIDS